MYNRVEMSIKNDGLDLEYISIKILVSEVINLNPIYVQKLQV
jgi:hypothetical protein